VTAPTQTSLTQTVSRLLESLDAMNLDALASMVDDEVQSIDEIAGGWVRGRSAMQGYLSQLKDTVSDVHSETRDVQEKAWGDTGLVTFTLDQTYTLDGQRQQISAPTSVVFQRRKSEWKIMLIHTVPLPGQA
jgi:acyl-CoA synthetase (AMP-forming)/AMP-acid ligase II